MSQAISDVQTQIEAELSSAPRPGGRKAYLIALGAAQGAAFLRSVVLARLLGPEQMGLAAILVVTAQFFDSITDTGNDRFLIQDRFGGSSHSLQLIHLIAISKGCLIALLLILLAGPIASFTGAPATAGALVVLAIVPFLNGFTNYDFRVAQRHHQFGPEAKVMFVSELSGLAATVVAAFAIRNFTAVLYGLAVRAATGAVVSHIVASRNYRPNFKRETAERLWRFGGPLMVNGLLIFLATQSDRVIISRYLGLAELGRYTIVLTLGLYPSLMLMRFVASMFLPIIAASRDRPSQMYRAADRLESGVMLAAVTMAVLFSLLVPPLLPLIFGAKFSASTTTVTLLGLVTSWRMMKASPTTVAIAVGQTHIMSINNFLRLLSIPAAIAAVKIFGGIAGVATGLIAGELVANAAATYMVNRAMRWPSREIALRYAFAIGVGACLLIRGALLQEGRSTWFAAITLLCVGLVAANAWYDRDTVIEIGKLFRRALKLETA